MKYQDLTFDNSLVKKDLQRLINQIWKLLPMRENNEDWQKQLSSVLIEIKGLHEMFGDQINLLIIISKLEGLKQVENLMIYRTTVFNVISLMAELNTLIDA